MKVYLFHTDFSPSSFLRYQGRRGQRKNRRLTLCSMNTRKSIFFSQSSVRIQLQDIKNAENSAPKRYKASRLIDFLHNLFYVLLFIMSFTDCIFDAFNCRNHCIFKILCIRHWYIFTCTTTDWCI